MIQIFEAEGFIWGGKWDFYDNMHFEYRPELREINRLLNLRAARLKASGGRALHHIYPSLR